MRFGIIEGRAIVLADDGTAIDVVRAGGGEFLAADGGADFTKWPEFCHWAQGLRTTSGEKVEDPRWDSPVVRAHQVFAIGLNYVDHAAEAQMQLPPAPMVFTKFASAISGPNGTVDIPDDGEVDWEAEIVAVIGRGGRNISEEDAWDHVAAITLGQDISERREQLSGSLPQFSLAKSHRGFAPLGPLLVSPDEFPNPSDIAFECRLNDEVVQVGQTRDMIFTVPNLIAQLSRTIEFLPGDLIFTGTPPGVGMGREPKWYVEDGDVLTSRAELVGEMTQVFRKTGERAGS